MLVSAPSVFSRSISCASGFSELNPVTRSADSSFERPHNPLCDHARRRVTWTSRSQSSTRAPAASASWTAASISAPGRTWASMPMRRWNAASTMLASSRNPRRLRSTERMSRSRHASGLVSVW